MNLSSVDLNLLVVLDALLQERSVTRAARRVGLSQPATSSALSRLRAHFEDPLFVRTARGIEPTPRAIAIAPVLASALEAVRATLAEPKAFDAANARRAFRLSVPDSLAVLVLPALLERIGREAPGIDLQLKPVVSSLDDADRALLEGELDVAVVPAKMPSSAERSGVQQRALWREEFVCVLREGHPLAKRRALKMDEWLALHHLLVAPRGTPGSLVDDTLARMGLARRVALMVPQFLLAAPVVARSDLAWTAPGHVARAMQERYRLVVKPVPFELEGFTLFLRWHSRFDRDAAHKWLRALLVSVADAMQTSSARRGAAVRRAQ
ncbi:MAG: LysR family transcriptional regulator [Myxococcales bacterium]|nr:LysR family transcriptional regulator [Myxococcales bacterium]